MFCICEYPFLLFFCANNSFLVQGLSTLCKLIWLNSFKVRKLTFFFDNVSVLFSRQCRIADTRHARLGVATLHAIVGNIQNVSRLWCIKLQPPMQLNTMFECYIGSRKFSVSRLDVSNKAMHSCDHIFLGKALSHISSLTKQGDSLVLCWMSCVI